MFTLLLNCVELALAVLTTMCFALRAMREHRLVEILMAASCASWVAGQLVWLLTLAATGAAPADLSWADAGYLTFHLLAPIALGMSVLPAMSARERVRTLIDAVNVASALLAIAWMVGLDALVRRSLHAGADLVSAGVQLAYPLLDVITIALAAVAVVGPVSKASLRALASGVVLMALSESTIALSLLADRPLWQDLTEAGFVAAWVLLLLTAVAGPLPARAVLPGAGDVVTAASAGEAAGPGLERSLTAERAGAHAASLGSVSTPATATDVGRYLPYLPYLPMCTAGAMAVGQAWTTQLDAWTISLLAAMVVAVLLRQSLLIADNANLVRVLAERGHLMHRLAHADALTGLANRRAFMTALHQAAAERSCSTVLFADLDGFKAINDECGHEVGDDVLVAVGVRLREVFREGDVIARLGGDEFAVLVRRADAHQGGALWRARVSQAVTELTRGAGDGLGVAMDIRGTATLTKVGVSVGSADLAEVGWDIHKAVRLADERMYASKAHRRVAPAV